MISLPLDTSELIEICRRNDVSMLGLFGLATEQTHPAERAKRILPGFFEY